MYRIYKEPLLCNHTRQNPNLKICKGEFPGGAVVRILGSHCQGYGFNPWSGY